MKLSIVMSTYNGEEYIVEQLDSIMNQKRKPDEVIIIDDFSKDSTYNIIENYIRTNNLKWKLLKNNKNKGWRANFFEGINLASGELIFPCDQDDIWDKDKLLVMEKIMKDNTHVNLLVSNYNAFYSNGRSSIGPNKNDKKIIKINYTNQFFYVPFPGCTFCLRKKFTDKVRKYWNNQYPHDAFYWRLALYSNQVYAINKDLINWRKHEESTFSKESRDNRNYNERKIWFDYAINSINSVKEYIKDENIQNKKIIKILEQNLKFIEKRKKFYDTKNIFLGIYLIRYINYYMSLKRYLGDLFLVYFKSEVKNES